MDIIPQMASATDVQRNYRKLATLAWKTKEPIIILKKNKPDTVLMSFNNYKKLKKDLQRAWEMADTLEAIRDAEKAKKEGRLKELKSLSELWDEPDED